MSYEEFEIPSEYEFAVPQRAIYRKTIKTTMEDGTEFTEEVICHDSIPPKSFFDDDRKTLVIHKIP